MIHHIKLTLAAIAILFAALLPAATATSINAAEIRHEIANSVRAFLRSWMRPTTEAASSRIAKDEAIARTMGRLRDTYAQALVHEVDLGFPMQDALDNGFTTLNELLLRHATADGKPTLSIRTMASVLARGILEGAAAAFAGVTPPAPTDPTEPIHAPTTILD